MKFKNQKSKFKTKKYFLEALWEGLLKISGSFTSIIILLIVFFLFSQGAGLFKKPAIEEGYELVVNSQNPVTKLTPYEVKEIFDYEIEVWSAIGIANEEDDILVFRLNDIESFIESEQDLEPGNIASTLNRIIESNQGIIAFIPKQYITDDFEAKVLDLGEIRPADFFGGKEWYPTAHPAPQFGILPIILGTLWVSLGAILLALPFGLSVAIYMAELANKRIYKMLRPTVELLAGIPSVVYGFFGLVVIVPMLQKVFDLPVGETGLAGSIILGIMALPTIITISEDALRSVPRSMREASLALGANHWQTIYKVIIPYSISGITAAVVLGIGRAIGETMAVLMVTGNSAIIPHTLLAPLRTIPATIAAELGEAPKGGTHYQALFLLGCVLFIMTLIINLTVEYITAKKRIKN
ncbi:MAG: phosphate ABC transporter permease subunit PstC [Bacteroidales bacterium]|jgi:phosphate transport system permease protein|nr:phosphate ABC transporter permease subunit PstC [Bacteroidales bacterium]